MIIWQRKSLVPKKKVVQPKAQSSQVRKHRQVIPKKTMPRTPRTPQIRSGGYIRGRNYVRLQRPMQTGGCKSCGQKRH